MLEILVPVLYQIVFQEVHILHFYGNPASSCTRRSVPVKWPAGDGNSLQVALIIPVAVDGEGFIPGGEFELAIATDALGADGYFVPVKKSEFDAS